MNEPLVVHSEKNVSRFGTVGVIPDDEYWCNQDALCVALAELAGERVRPPPGKPLGASRKG